MKKIYCTEVDNVHCHIDIGDGGRVCRVLFDAIRSQTLVNAMMAEDDDCKKRAIKNSHVDLNIADLVDQSLIAGKLGNIDGLVLHVSYPYIYDPTPKRKTAHSKPYWRQFCKY